MRQSRPVALSMHIELVFTLNRLVITWWMRSAWRFKLGHAKPASERMSSRANEQA